MVSPNVRHLADCLDDSEIGAGMTDKRKSLGCGQALLICAAALGIVLYAVWPNDKEMTDQRDSVLAGAAQEEASADQFVEAFRSNEVAAGERFRGKALRITGKVEGVEESNSDAMVVRFETQSGPALNVSVDGVDRAAVAAVQRGQTITVHCATLLEVLGARVPSQCRLLGTGGGK